MLDTATAYACYETSEVGQPLLDDTIHSNEAYSTPLCHTGNVQAYSLRDPKEARWFPRGESGR
jgi:hypothetical protein